MGWQIAMNAKIGFKHQVTAPPGFDSADDCWYRTMWLISCVPDDPEDDTAMEKHGADALYSAVKSLMHPIRTEDQQAEQDEVHWMLQIAKPWTIRR